MIRIRCDGKGGVPTLSPGAIPDFVLASRLPGRRPSPAMDADCVRLHPPPAASVRNATVAGPARRAVSAVAVCIHPVSGYGVAVSLHRCPARARVTWPGIRRSGARRRSRLPSSSATKARKESSDSGLWRRGSTEVFADAARRHDAAVGQRPRRHRGRCPRRRAASGPGRPAAVDRARDIIGLPGDRPVHSRPPAGHRRGRRVRRLLLRRPVLADPDEARPTRARSGLLVRATAELATPKPWFAIGGNRRGATSRGA